ncbi:MAG: hypothetical protein GEV10_07995 [Streptosporangiales bacterium]|nr:hypothetical protein [Streptosporangiales bacterium]
MRKLPGRRRTREFSRAVDGGATPGPSVSRLVTLANALRAVPLRPGGDLRQAIRRRLETAATTTPVTSRRAAVLEWLDHLRIRRGLASTTVMVTAAVAITGIGVGTMSALPGDTLYGVKLRGESVQLAFVNSDEERGRKNLRFADSRLEEVDRLVEHGGVWPSVETAKADGHKGGRSVAGLINRTLTTMNTYTDSGAHLLRSAYQATGETQPLSYLDEFTRDQSDAIRALLPRLPGASRGSASRSLDLVSELSRQTTTMLQASCRPSASCDGETASSSGSSSSTQAGDPSTSAPPISSSSSSALAPGSSTGSGSSSSQESSNGGSTDPPPGSGTSGSGSTTGGSSGGTDPSGTGTPSEGSPSSSPPQPTGVPSQPSDSTGSQDSTTSADESTSSGDEVAPDAERTAADATSTEGDG